MAERDEEPEDQRFDAELVEAVSEGEQASGAGARDEPRDEQPDVYLDVPALQVDEINLEVDNLRARVSLQAEVLDLLKLNVGVDAVLGQVVLEINGVEAQAQLNVRLGNVADILERVMTTIDRNPQILEQVTRGVGGAAQEVGEGAGGAAKEVVAGAGEAVEDVGEGAGEAVEQVDSGAGEAAEDVANELGRGAADTAEQLRRGARGAGEEDEGVEEDEPRDSMRQPPKDRRVRADGERRTRRSTRDGPSDSRRERPERPRPARRERRQ